MRGAFSCPCGASIVLETSREDQLAIAMGVILGARVVGLDQVTKQPEPLWERVVDGLIATVRLGPFGLARGFASRLLEKPDDRNTLLIKQMLLPITGQIATEALDDLEKKLDFFLRHHNCPMVRGRDQVIGFRSPEAEGENDDESATDTDRSAVTEEPR